MEWSEKDAKVKTVVQKLRVLCLPGVVSGLLFFGLLVIFGAGCSPEDKKEQALQRAKAHFRAGDYEKARLEYQNVLSLDQRDFQARAGLGTIYFERGQILTAFPYLATTRLQDSNNLAVALQLGLSFQASHDLDKAWEEALFILEKNPKHAEAALLLAETARSFEKMAEAERRLDDLQKQTGEKAGICLARSVLYLKQGKTEAAEAAVRRAGQLEPDAPLVITALANLHWAKGELDEADKLFAMAAQRWPIRSPRQLRRVDFKFQTGAVAEAKKILEEITERAPDQIPALIYQSKIAFSEKKLGESARINRAVLALDRLNFDALLLQGRQQMAENKTDAALTAFEQIKAWYPNSTELRYYLALAHLAKDQIDKAVADLMDIPELDMDYTAAPLLLADLKIRKNDPSAAVPLLLAIVEKQPKLAQAYLLLGRAYRAQERWQEMLAVYEKLAVFWPQDPEPHFQMGLAFRQQGETNKARASFLRTHTLDPKHVQALSQLVDLDLADKNYPAARQRVAADLASNPDLPDLYFLQAKIYLAQKNSDQAEESLLKALELNPAYQPAYAALAEMYVNSQKHELALEKLHAGLLKNPKDVVPLMLIGLIHEETKDYAKAATAYEQLLALNPTFVLALNNLAYIYTERLPQLDRALALAQKARQLSNDPYTADTLGWAMYRRGDYGWALKLLQEAAEKTPDRANILGHLGLAYYMNGIEVAARESLVKALASPQKFAGRTEAETHLAVLDIDLAKPAPPIMEELQAILAQRPHDLMAWLRLGAIHESSGALEKARLAYEKALQINPQAVSTVVRLAQFYTEQLHDQAKALEMAKIARTLAPDDVYVIETLGLLAYKSHDYPWALTLLQQSNERRSGQPVTLYYLSLFNFHLGKLSPAREFLLEALKVAPHFPQAVEARRLLVFLELCANPEKAAAAETTIQAALQTEPEYVPALLAQGLAQQKKENFIAARQTYEKILARSPQLSIAARNLGILYAEQFKEEQRAINLLTKVRAEFPEDTEVARVLGVLAYHRNDFVWSAQLLKQAITDRYQPTTNPSAIYYLGLAQYRQRQIVACKTTLQEALALAPQNPLAPEAQRILTELK